MNVGAIILCGGRSSRMNVDKALLPYGNETMLERVVRIVSSIVDPRHIVVVAAANQQLPAMKTIVVRDRVEHQGPLQALAGGFAALPPDTEAVFITGCDTPLLNPAVIESLFQQLGDSDAVVPQDAERLYPLCGVYRTNILTRIEQQITLDRRSLHEFIEQIDAKLIPLESLREIDPELMSLKNVNSHEDYLSALECAGFSTP